MTTFHPASLRKLSALRAQLEAFAAHHAAGRAREDLESQAMLHDALLRLQSAVRAHDYEAFRDADTELHQTMVRMADVPLLPDLWQQVWNALSQFHREAFDEYFPDLRTLMEEHVYLVDTISRADPVAAEDAARSHIEAVWLRVAEKQQAPSQESDALQRAAAHIAFRLNAPLKLQDLAARIAFTSPGNLSRLFREHYGISFQGYVQKLRMEKAAELLAQTRMPVASICKRVGYRDLSRFGQHFKRAFGRAPSQWRKEQAGE